MKNAAGGQGGSRSLPSGRNVCSAGEDEQRAAGGHSRRPRVRAWRRSGATRKPATWRRQRRPADRRAQGCCRRFRGGSWRCATRCRKRGRGAGMAARASGGATHRRQSVASGFAGAVGAPAGERRRNLALPRRGREAGWAASFSRGQSGLRVRVSGGERGTSLSPRTSARW
ncbi:MAG: hypothetical protein RLZZ15_2772 [Verrucomicrobiota bacterium]|jgi:hypothetical protein